MSRFDLPPLNALRAFEAAARHGRFTAAARELLVTPTAISHQIRQLEAFMGLRVLNRTPRFVRLTPEGQVLYDAAAAGFAEVGRAVARLRAPPAPAMLTLTAPTAFVSHWLVPRLSDLQSALPDLNFRLHTSNAVVDLRPHDIEVAIRYGKGPFDGVESTLLADDGFVPVCSPLLGIRDKAGLRAARLIHVDGHVAPRPAPDWARWCREFGHAGIDTTAGLRFSDSLHATQAAISGQGVALASRILVSDALKSGLLMQPFPETLSGDGYHFACAQGLSGRDDIGVLRQWFCERLRVQES